MNTELAHELVRILGEKKILQLHSLLGRAPVSFAMLVNFMCKHRLLLKLDSKEFISVTAFAKKHGKSKSTIYRALKKLRKIKCQKSTN